MTFAQKTLTVTITLGTGNFKGTSSSSVVLTNMRMQCDVSAYNGATMGCMHLRIYGLTMDMMTQLTRIGPINGQINVLNSILVQAGDNGLAPTTIFMGTISEAWADLKHAPDAALTLVSYSALWVAVLNTPVVSIPGAQNIAGILTAIINNINAISPPSQQLTLNNSAGVSTLIKNPLYRGDGLNQIRQVCNDARCNHKIENNVVTIWPSVGATEDPVVYVSPSTNMVGYPVFCQQGVQVKCLFLQGLQQGQYVNISGCVIPSANNVWQAQQVSHSLETLTPGGAWFTNFTGTRGLGI